MKFEILTKTSRSISIELLNNFAYYNDKEFDVYLNGKLYYENIKTNVVSIYDLNPNTKYELKINDYEIDFVTDYESFVLNVKDFRAIGDGITDDTLAIQTAIMCASKNSTIYIPKGTYLIRPIFLKSDITLYLEKDALIVGDYNRDHYPVLPGIIKGSDGELNLGTWEGDEVECFASTITGINVSNVKIVGEGAIDCQSTLGDWYTNHRVKRIAWRPFGVYFNRCNNILMQGISVRNTPSWNIHPYFSNDLTFIDLKLENPHHMPTTDGLDPDCCSDVKIIGLYISVGDDCIAIKSGQIDLAKKHLTPSKDIEIRNCLMEHGHGGVVFGSESSAGILNVNVTRCIFHKTDRGLRIKTRRGRGRYGIIDNVNFDNIIMDHVDTPFVVNMYYNMGPVGGHEEYAWTKEKLPVDERTPYIGHFHFKNMKCINVTLAAGMFLGLPEEPIKGITLENISFEYDINATAGFPVMVEHKTEVLRHGLDFSNVDNVKIINVSFKDVLTQEIICENVLNLTKE